MQIVIDTILKINIHFTNETKLVNLCERFQMSNLISAEKIKTKQKQTKQNKTKQTVTCYCCNWPFKIKIFRFCTP